jgi:hypothetical protein
LAVLPTISETISIGRISTYKAANDNAEGALFGKRLASPTSPVTIAMVTDALEWGNDGGAQTDTVRQVANYLIWLCGKYALQARAILNITSGGGSVTPSSGGDSVFPIYITDSNFTNATQYEDSRINGRNIIVYFNEINRYLIPSTEFSVSGDTLTILVPGFDATANTYNLVIEKYTPGV